jgi:CBS domain-containing protein
VMTKEIVAGPDEDVDTAIQKMHSTGSRHLPVATRKADR